MSTSSHTLTHLHSLLSLLTCRSPARYWFTPATTATAVCYTNR